MLPMLQRLTDALGGRKAVAMLIVLAIVALLLLTCLSGLARVPPDQLPLVDKALELLKWSFTAFMAGNAVSNLSGVVASGKAAQGTPAAGQEPGTEGGQ